MVDPNNGWIAERSQTRHHEMMSQNVHRFEFTGSAWLPALKR
jgi:hypothetical protein